MSPNRPNPDTLLADLSHQEAKQKRGKLKVFFGMAPGVGKTYAMLEEARKRAAEGANVLIGYAEPHIRPETEALLLGMEILPYRMVEYRGTQLKEFDLDAAMSRKPAILCVDELAHTNAPGGRHPKRWQDVVELLDAGISVYTTLNVQHLESYNDVVERIIGVRVQETLPDSILEQADEVELVDIAPEELLERLNEGKVYSPQQAEYASKHFFKMGNLIALREMALRKTAERVDEQIQDYHRRQSVRRIIPASERVLVCVGPSPLSARLVRSARRLATGMRAKLIAAHVQTPTSARAGDKHQQRLDENLRLAEQLGALTIVLSGQNVADEILAYATANNVTKIVIGKPVRSRWHDALFGSIVDDLVRRSGEIDIYVIRGEASPAEQRPQDGKVPAKFRGWDVAGCVWAVAIVLVTTAIGWPLYHGSYLHVENVNILMLYLLGVLWIATHHSRTAAILASVLSVAAFDLIFVEPYYTLAITDRQYLVTFGVMLWTALVISELTYRVRAQVESARHRERRMVALLGMTRELSGARTVDEIVTATQRHISESIGLKAWVLPLDRSGKLTRPRPSEAANDGRKEFMIDEKEMLVAEWACQRNQAAGRGTTTLPGAAATYVPLRGPRGAVGVLAIVPSDGSADWSGERRSLIEAFSAQAALGIERAILVDEARVAWERAEAELLRNTLLSGVSHDLRTPLTVISGLARNLVEVGGQYSSEAQHEMLDSIYTEAERMERLVDNLLEMTRLESGGVELRREWQHLDDAVGATLRSLAKRLGRRGIKASIPADLPLVWIDDVAIGQVLANLVDNAIEYTPDNQPIELVATSASGEIIVEVRDRGPGLPAGAEKRVFEKFFRARSTGNRSHRGIGLGLAICKALVEAHGGKISAENRSGGGALFRFTLPLIAPPSDHPEGQRSLSTAREGSMIQP